jgi:serine/threonine-protein kinase
VSEEDLYEKFVDGYFETGVTEVPEDWPADVRERCLFFLQMVKEDDPQMAETSLVATLSKSGITANVDLEELGDLPTLAAHEENERYVMEREIARGGMGRILIAYDRDFRRRIAVKVLLSPIKDHLRTSRFLEEAQATAQLEHPNIAPVYDLGTDSSGSPFFTMKWIRGRDLKELVAQKASEYTLIRWIQILQQAAMGIHFANSRGVVHRDLKPQNIMVGDYGEVLVVDWGLAKILKQTRDGERKDDPGVSTERGEEGDVTLDGTVQGSLPYMAPEQARGEVGEIDAMTDVFGLGAILYEILTGSPPHSASSFQALLQMARRGDVPPPREQAPERNIPEELDSVCRKALSPRKADRFRSARELHDALQQYIEGIHDAERRAAEAARLLEVAGRLWEDLRGSEKREEELRREERSLNASLAPYAPEEKKSPLWELSARVTAAGEETAGVFNRTTAAYTAVLSIDPENQEARAALAAIYYDRLRAAETRREPEAAALYEGLVSQYHDGRYRVELEGEGLLCLTTDPPGAEVLLSRYEERGPLLVETAPTILGKTPIEKHLPRGSYLATVRLPHHSEVRYPVWIERSGEYSGHISLVPEGSTPGGFVQVPGGLTLVGRETDVLPGIPRERIVIPEVFVARFPVTFQEYCEFLSEESGEPPEGQEHFPSFAEESYVERNSAGRLAPLSKLDPKFPVIAIPLESSQAYCKWLGKRLGKRVRLPTEPEWERVARGADGRVYPWGNQFDWVLCKGGSSRRGEPSLEAVGAFPRDVSPFGVRDLAGGVREFCEGSYSEGYTAARGGSWFNPSPFVFRTDCRTGVRKGNRITDVGFRVCYDE